MIPLKRTLGLAAVSVTLSAACATSTPEPDVRIVRGATNRVETNADEAGIRVTDFVPLVAPRDGRWSCYGPYENPMRSTSVVGLRLEGDPRRQVALEFVESGHVRSYNELRGPVPGVTNEPGNSTGIFIDFAADFMVLQNAEEGEAPQVIRFSSVSGLDAPNLDFPNRWIERVKSECMGADRSLNGEMES